MPLAALGKYRLLGELGRGGTGIVYRSEDPTTSRALAIKTVKSSLRSDRAALEREIAALARLTTKRPRGVVELLDAGLEGAAPWYAMPFVFGQSMRDYGRELWADARPRGTLDPAADEASTLATLDAAQLAI